MTKTISWLLSLMMICTFGLVGCGGPGGSEGDTNDPATAGSDDEQMQDESGDMQMLNETEDME